MDSPDNVHSPNTRRPHRRELVGPRPTPLKLNKDSHKIKKPAPASQPVVIYAVSPKVIHTNPSDFMSVVQRLTGPDPAIEKTHLPLGGDTTGYGLMEGRPGGGLTRPVSPTFHVDDLPSSPNSMLSPASVEFLSEFLNQ